MKRLVTHDNWPVWVVGIVLLFAAVYTTRMILLGALWLPCE